MIEYARFDAAVEVGVAAFCEGAEPPTDAEVRQRLTGTGVEPWLAERLVLLLPLAYTRQLLPDVSYADGLAAPAGRVSLRDEPVFAAAFARAGLARRDEVERIALRSSEFAVINNALNAGAQLSDLVLAETALPDDLGPAGPGDGGVPSPQAVLEALLAGHGVDLDDETRVEAKLFVHPAPAGMPMAQVDVAVTHPALDRPRLVESFAGHGPTWRVAISRAVSTFERGSLHPIVDALLRPGAAADQVRRERYEHPGGSFDLVLGPQLNYFASQPVPAARPLLDRLLEALRKETLSPKVHSLRLFVAHQDGRLHTNEVLLDSETWPAGEAVVADSQAPLPEGMVAVRVFGLLVPRGE